MEKINSKLQEYAGKVHDWSDITRIMERLRVESSRVKPLNAEEFRSTIQRGVAFVTYEFGIDGVSIEIHKYAECLEQIFPGLPLHFISGDFSEQADTVLKPEWHRCHIDNINGWDKWCDGKYFSRLFYEDMPAGSEISQEMAGEIWRQAADFAAKLGEYLEHRGIRVLIPVNVASNPGNPALTLAVILVSEILNAYVVSSNHDYYWEGGKPASERLPDEAPGPRDSFFHNQMNHQFFSLFESMYPWNGPRWVQVNINSQQSNTLIEKFGFAPERVFELGTSVSDEFFIESTPELLKSVRSRMNYIVSDGAPEIDVIDVKKHLADLNAWLHNQQPLACGNRAGLKLNLAAPNTLYCLQPTRIISRKHIERDIELFEALLRYHPFAEYFQKNSACQLILHITGPTPIEHQQDLELILATYMRMTESLPPETADRIFLVFSVGHENHPCFEAMNLKPLCIEEIYQLADLILFPSETEGRGLPIIEASAGGIPIACRRYYPEAVFAEVVGEHLPEAEQIQYIRFPEKEFSEDFLENVTAALLHPESYESWRRHNREAVRSRYSMAMIARKLKKILEQFA